MPRRSKYNWPELIAEFEASGLKQSAFCKAQNLNPRYFSLRYTKHRKERAEQGVGALSGFIELQTNHTPRDEHLTLNVGKAQLRFTTKTDPAYIAQILRLAS